MARVVQEDEIEIRGVTELVAAELPVTHGADLHGATPGPVEVVSLRHAELRRDLRPREPHGDADDDLGDLREVVADAHQRDLAREVGHGHPKDRCALKLPQHFDLPVRLVLREVCKPRGDFGFELGPRCRKPA